MLVLFKKPVSKSQRLIIRDTSIKTELTRLLFILALLLVLHILAMIYIEGLSVSDAVWLTMTSATTVGYGDFSAKTNIGRFSTIILLYIGGIAILAQVAAKYFEYRQEIRDRLLKGDWSFKMENHILFINCPDEVDEEYFYQAISGLRKSKAYMALLPIIIVNESFENGISDKLRKLDVAHVRKNSIDNEALNSANFLKANTIIILSKQQLDPLSDSINFELIDRIREAGFTGRIIAEAVKDENRNRLKKVGADNVLRPIRAYPELLMRSIIAPGSEQVIETLFDSFGEECIRYEVSVKSSWLEIIQKITTSDLGIPIAYENTDGKIINNPSVKSQVDTRAIFLIVSEGKIKENSEIEAILN